jgi:hypothetical protein
MGTEGGRISKVGKLYMRGLFETVQILHRATSLKGISVVASTLLKAAKSKVAARGRNA